MEHTERYPLDFDVLQKGDVIPIGQCERIVGFHVGHERYRFGIMRLAENIEQQLGIRSRPATVRVRNNQVVILTDAEAVAYHERRHRIVKRGLRRNLKRAARIDVGLLNAEEREQYEKNIKLMMAEQIALRKAKRLVMGENGKPKAITDDSAAG